MEKESKPNQETKEPENDKEAITKPKFMEESRPGQESEISTVNTVGANVEFNKEMSLEALSQSMGLPKVNMKIPMPPVKKPKAEGPTEEEIARVMKHLNNKPMNIIEVPQTVKLIKLENREKCIDIADLKSIAYNDKLSQILLTSKDGSTKYYEVSFEWYKRLEKVLDVVSI